VSAQRGEGARLVANVAVQAGALLSLALATVLVARLGGPSGVGAFALLRLLPWLVAVVVSAGLPGAVAYFLAGPARTDTRLAPTIAVLALGAGAGGLLLWVAGAPVVRAVLLPQWSTGLVAWAGLKVASRLAVITTKACAQGLLDVSGANRVILLEELAFLPAFGVAWAAGARGGAALVAGLVLGDAVTIAVSAPRLAARGFWRGAAAPSVRLAARIAAFGARAQLGSLATLLNLRLDVLLLGALAGPAQVGTYAVASRFAELLRLPGIAAYWVLAPRFARDDPPAAMRRARHLLPRLGAATAAGALPLAAAAPLIVPTLYGPAFRPGVLAAQVLLVGLVADGFGGVVTAFLYGSGRPGRISIATGLGVVVTIVLDLVLIPGHGMLGAAAASACAYLATTCALLVCFRLVARGAPPAAVAMEARSR
jgi:O-antigen/teichoic acid export membrane protein